MDIRNLQTDEVKDSKEWAEELGLNRRSFERKVDNGELLFERVEKPVQEIAVEKTTNDPKIDEFLRQEREIWGPMGGHKHEPHQKLEFGIVERDEEAGETRMSLETWYALKDKKILDSYTAKNAKPRVIPDILAGNAETWIAPVGGCDYVVTQSGRKILMKHAPTDSRYNEEFDGKPCGLSACKYLDLNDIILD